jgi:hypothetical protein
MSGVAAAAGQSRAMQIETVAIASLSPPPRNTRRHPEAQITEFCRALLMFGQTRPIVIDEGGQVLAGNGLVEAAKKLEWSEVQAIRMLGLSETDKGKLILSDNKIFQMGVDDYDAIKAVLGSLGDYDVPGFDEELLRGLIGNVDQLTEAFTTNYGRLSPDEIAAAQGRSIPQGSTQPAPVSSGDGAHALNGSGTQRIVICPHCKGEFRLDGPT